MTVLQTERLRLLAMLPAQLRQCRDAPELLETELEIAILRSALGDPLPRVVGEKLSNIGRFPNLPNEWFTYWLLVEQQQQQGIGFAGFKGYPREGMAEIGYGLDASYWNRGYMTEAVQALAAWGLSQPECTQVIAETARGNIGSERVLQKVGFRLDEETVDFRYWSIQ